MTNYQRITEEERKHIFAWKQEGKSNCEIARLLRRWSGTIGRELTRNSAHTQYRPGEAHARAGICGAT